MVKVAVNPAILSWAREGAGLTLEEAAAKLRLKGARGIKATARLQALENGDDLPSRALLVKMAKAYRQPLLTFYLRQPPRKAERGADSGTLPTSQASKQQLALVDLLLRDVRARQSLVRSMLEDEEEAAPLPFIGSRQVRDGNDAVLDSLARLLAVDHEHYRQQPNPGRAFNLLRTQAEKAGIFVLLQSDLGSYHTALDISYFRGFAIADKVAPFIVINKQDALPAWSFTLVHEIVHLLLGETGVSGNANAEHAIEKCCSDVASEFLLPKHELQRLDLNRAEDNVEDAARKIGEFARKRHLSQTMVAHAAWRTGKLRRPTYIDLASLFRNHWLEKRAARRERARVERARAKQTKTKLTRAQPPQDPGYYVVRRHRTGNALIHLVRRMMDAGEISVAKSAIILGVEPKNVHALLY